MYRRLAWILAALLLTACPDDPKKDDASADGPPADVALEASPGMEGGVVDAGDASQPIKEGGSADVCAPGCHWDCFYHGSTCSTGKVWRLVRGPRPCCKPGAPWPGAGPACTMDTPLRTCTSGKCQTVDSRYKHCLAPTPKYGPMPTPGQHDHLLAMHCAETKFHKPGDPCKTAKDCRPMAASVAGRLTCHAVTGKCTEMARPKAPADLGKGCGLKLSDLKSKPTKDLAWKGKSCSTCHLVWNAAKACLAQGCTTTCQYDEDCPKGMVCVCLEGQVSSTYQVVQICAAATARDSVAGRTAGLKCP